MTLTTAYVVFWSTVLVGVLYLLDDRRWQRKRRAKGDYRARSLPRTLVTVTLAVLLPIIGTWSGLVILSSYNDPFRGVF